MLGWLSKNLGLKKASTHPLATPQSLREVIDELPAGNPIRALADLADWLAMAERRDLQPDERIVAIRTLDEHAIELNSELIFEYLSCLPTHHRAEQMWHALSTYQDAVFKAYRLAFRDLFEAGKPRERDKSTATLFAVRAMAAITERKKLLRMRYRAVDAGLWADLYGLVQIAEGLGIARKDARLASGVQTSVWRELLAGTWFELGPIGNLDHLQMEQLDRIVRDMLKLFAVRAAPDTETRFVLDLATTAPPQRWRDQKARELRHFLAPGAAYAHLVSLVREIRRNGALPGYLVMEGLESLQSCVNLIDKLVPQWSKNPPRRAHERKALNEPVEVVHGYREIRRMIAGIAYLRLTGGKAKTDLSGQQREEFSRHGFIAEQRDPQQQIDDEIAKVRALIESQNRLMVLEWTLHDLSEFGAGALAQGTLHWLQPGVLIGLRWGGREDWQSGVVRRISRDARGQASIGIQRFQGVARCGRIGVLDKPQASAFERSRDAGVSVYFDAIALLEDSSLLVESGVYVENGRFRLVIDGQRTTVVFVELLERGTNFEHVRFAIETDEQT